MSLSEAGSWLCERHSDLQDLVMRIGAWDAGAPVMWKIRAALNVFDDEPAAEIESSMALSVMAPGQVGRLRLLATLAPRSAYGQSSRFCVEDLESFDAVGKDLIADWLRCIRIGVLG